jgi:hypothetical protein
MANEFRVRKKLIVNGSGSVILDVQGSQGQLFSITDSLSGSLFSVKDISGIPVMEAFSDDTVNIGTFNAEAIKVSGSFARITGSLLGTASWSNNAVTSSYALTASLLLGSVVSASYAATASSADNFTVRGTLTAQTIVAQTITSSTDFVTGSTRFGSSLDNTHQFTGSVSITGSLTLPYLSTGSILFTGATDNITEDNSNLFWDNTNKRLGINTNTPLYAVDAVGSNFRFGRGGTADFDVSNTADGRIIRINATTSDVGIQTLGSYNLGFNVNFNRIMTLTTSNVLIGTTSDTGERFQVSGSSRFGGNMIITGSLSMSGSSPLIQLGSTTFVGDITNPAITFGSTSNGIYTDSSRVFFKAGGSFAGGFSSDGIIANQILIRNTAPNDLTTAMYIPYRLNAIGLLGGLGGNDTGAVTLITSGSARLYVSSSGNIGIGTNTPTVALQVASDAIISGIRVGNGPGTGNVYIGQSVGGISTTNAQSMDDNVFIGRSAGSTFSGNSNGNVAIGVLSLKGGGNQEYNTAVGYLSLQNFTGQYTTALGYNAGGNLTSGNLNTIIGYNTGLGITTGGSNTIIGAQITGLATNLANTIAISDGAGTIRIYSPSTGNVLIQNGGTFTDTGERFQVSGSTKLLGNTVITGSLTVTEGITGSLFGTSSWANNASTASYIINAVSASFASTSSIATSASFALTASSADNFLVRGTLTAQTIVAQTITSSTDFVTGSTRFGSLLSDTHQFTGSVSITGSLTLPYLSTGSVLFTGQGGSISQNNANFFWDNTNSVLGLGTNTPFTTTGGARGLVINSGANNDCQIRIQSNATGTTSLDGFIFSINSVLNAFLWNYENASLIFGTNNTERFRVFSTGNVGIATTTDTGERLQVSGSSRFGGNIVITGSANITQALTASAALISGSGTQRLTVVGSGSAQPLFTVQGSQGELFSIVDSLSGSLFSVNDQSGLPIMEVFSDNTILMGNYLDPMLLTTTRTGSAAGINTLYTLPTSSYDAIYIDYTIRSGSNARAGNFMAMWSGTSVNFTDNSITEFGTTSGFIFGANVSGSNMVVTGSSPTAGWTVKTIIKAI